MSGWRTRLCGCPTSSSWLNPLVSMKAGLQCTMTPRVSVIDTSMLS
jgi:hypothetical protein